VTELSAALRLEQATVARALRELEDCGLLDAGPGAGLTRREAAGRLAKAGRAAVSAPLIYSIAAPTPALAASQAFCTALGCVGDCAACTGLGCACCNSTRPIGNNKLCTANCTTANCNAAVLAAHGCGSALASCSG
jgi:hypothetical protein